MQELVRLLQEASKVIPLKEVLETIQILSKSAESLGVVSKMMEPMGVVTKAIEPLFQVAKTVGSLKPINKNLKKSNRSVKVNCCVQGLHAEKLQECVS